MPTSWREFRDARSGLLMIKKTLLAAQHACLGHVDHLFHVGAGGVGIPIVQHFKSIYAEPVPVSSQFAESISLRIRTL